MVELPEGPRRASTSKSLRKGVSEGIEQTAGGLRVSVSCNPGRGARPEGSQVGAERGGEALTEVRAVVRAENPASDVVLDEVALAADSIADQCRHAQVHGFVHGKTPGLVEPARGEDEDVGEEVAHRHLRLIREREEVDAMGAGGIGTLEKRTFVRAVADEDQCVIAGG